MKQPHLYFKEYLEHDIIMSLKTSWEFVTFPVLFLPSLFHWLNNSRIEHLLQKQEEHIKTGMCCAAVNQGRRQTPEEIQGAAAGHSARKAGEPRRRKTTWVPSLWSFTLLARDHRRARARTSVPTELPSGAPPLSIRVLTGDWGYLATGGLEGRESRTTYWGRMGRKRNQLQVSLKTGLPRKEKDVLTDQLLQYLLPCNKRQVSGSFWNKMA